MRKNVKLTIYLFSISAPKRASRVVWNHDLCSDEAIHHTPPPSKLPVQPQPKLQQVRSYCLLNLSKVLQLIPKPKAYRIHNFPVILTKI